MELTKEEIEVAKEMGGSSKEFEKEAVYYLKGADISITKENIDKVAFEMRRAGRAIAGYLR